MRCALHGWLTNMHQRVSQAQRDVLTAFELGISPKGVTICSLPLPVSAPFKEDEAQLVAAACALAQVLAQSLVLNLKPQCFFGVTLL